MLQTLLFRTPVRAYRMVYVGALLSYAIVVLKSLGKPRGVNWLRRAFVDENFQYGLLALYWLISKPINSEFERARLLRRSTSASRVALDVLQGYQRPPTCLGHERESTASAPRRKSAGECPARHERL